MRAIRWASMLLAGLGAVAAGSARGNQDAAGSEDAIATAEARARPTDAHRVLAALAGTWKLDATVHREAKLPPVKLTGVTENTWVLGGRFLQCTAHLSDGKTQLETLTTYGFDTSVKEYVSYSISNVNTGYTVAHGSYYEGNRSLVLRTEPRLAGAEVRWRRREIIRLENADRVVVEVFSEPTASAPVKVFDAVYTRN